MRNTRLPLALELLGWLLAIGGAAWFAVSLGVAVFGIMLVVAANSAGGTQ